MYNYKRDPDVSVLCWICCHSMDSLLHARVMDGELILKGRALKYTKFSDIEYRNKFRDTVILYILL